MEISTEPRSSVHSWTDGVSQLYLRLGSAGLRELPALGTSRVFCCSLVSSVPFEMEQLQSYIDQVSKCEVEQKLFL
jgi:hypothetical protein